MTVENDGTHYGYDTLKNSERILMEVKLKPVQGDRFQPTGFPDIGAAVYERPDGNRMILLESAQSMPTDLKRCVWRITESTYLANSMVVFGGATNGEYSDVM
jgi:hypothetical protein